MSQDSQNAVATGTQDLNTAEATSGKRPADALKNFPKVSRTLLQNDLNVEFNALKSGYDTSKTRRLQNWREYNFELYGNEVQGQSTIVDSAIFNAIEWYLPTLIQPFMETGDFLEITPNSADLKHIVGAEIIREILNVQIRRRNPYYQVLYDTLKSCLVQGISYIKVKWVKKTKDVPAHPQLIAIPASQIRYNWTSQTFTDSPMVTQEEDMSRSDILKLMEDTPGLIKKQFDMMLAPPGRNMKIGRLRDEEVNQRDWVGEDDTKSSLSQSLYTRREHWTQYDMEGDGKASEIMAVFINDVLVQVIKNPFDFQHHPFVACEAIRDPLGNPAYGIATILSDIQKMRTGILRMSSDNLNAQHNGIYEMDMTNIEDVGRLLLENAPMGMRTGIPVRKPGSIVPLPAAPLAPQALTTWDLITNAGENRSGVTRYSQGLDSSSLNQTATGITQILQRSDMRSWEIDQRFAEMCLKPMCRMLISMNQQFLEKQDLQLQFGLSPQVDMERGIAFSGEEAGKWLKEISKDDIGGYYTVSLDVKVGADIQQGIENKLQFLQFGAPFINQETPDGNTVNNGLPPAVISAVFVELAKDMGLEKVQAIMRRQYVGTAGVSVPAEVYAEGSEEGAGEIGGGGPGLDTPEEQSGLQTNSLAELLGGSGGDGAAAGGALAEALG